MPAAALGARLEARETPFEASARSSVSVLLLFPAPRPLLPPMLFLTGLNGLECSAFKSAAARSGGFPAGCVGAGSPPSPSPEAATLQSQSPRLSKRHSSVPTSPWCRFSWICWRGAGPALRPSPMHRAIALPPSSPPPPLTPPPAGSSRCDSWGVCGARTQPLGPGSDQAGARQKRSPWYTFWGAWGGGGLAFIFPAGKPPTGVGCVGLG